MCSPGAGREGADRGKMASPAAARLRSVTRLNGEPALLPDNSQGAFSQKKGQALGGVLGIRVLPGFHSLQDSGGETQQAGYAEYGRQPQPGQIVAEPQLNKAHGGFDPKPGAEGKQS